MRSGENVGKSQEIPMKKHRKLRSGPAIMEASNHRRKPSMLKKRGLALGLALLLALGWAFAEELPPELQPSAANETASPEATEEWLLMLVNRDHPIPDDYEIGELVQLRGGQSVDRRIYPDLQAMFDAARAEGVYPIVGSGFRTHEKQQSLMDQKIADYRAEGYSEAEAIELAEAWVAVPGTSEHEVGICADINADSGSTSDEVYSWLAENAWQYGFILRYPEDKTDITGTIYEPWHYRYVGREAAAEIYASGLCLEEYLAQ
ncbi:MAG TPA: M15 family metallopeptidase [Candidatus Faecivicinus avistercoris]|nr:M15 family metallopeptidase [Candidatus Faecivicinus avistercoris]